MFGRRNLLLVRPLVGWRGSVGGKENGARLFRWSIITLFIALVVWGLVDVRRRGYLDPQHPESHRTDFTVYTIAGEAMLFGGDPYSVANVRGWKYIYPPLFALVVSPLASLDPENQVFVWFVVSLLMGWGCIRECVRITEVVLPDEQRRGPFGVIPTWIGAAAVTAAAIPALNCLQRGQTGIAVLYFLLLGFRLLAQSRTARGTLLAGVVLALPIVLKATPLLPVTFALAQLALAAWYSPGRASRFFRPIAGVTGVALGLMLFLLLVPTLIIGWQPNMRHLGTWWTTVAQQEEHALRQDYAGDNTTERNQSLTNAVHRFGNWAAGEPQPLSGVWTPPATTDRPMDTQLVKDLLLAIRLGVGCLLAAVGYRMARMRDSLGMAVGFSLAYLATLIVCQIARGHYFVIWLPAVIFTSVWMLRQGRPRLAAWHAVVPGMLVLVHYLFLSTAGSIGLLGLGTAAWYVSACVSLLIVRPKVQIAAEVLNAEPLVIKAA